MKATPAFSLFPPDTSPPQLFPTLGAVPHPGVLWLHPFFGIGSPQRLLFVSFFFPHFNIPPPSGTLGFVSLDVLSSWFCQRTSPFFGPAVPSVHPFLPYISFIFSKVLPFFLGSVCMVFAANHCFSPKRLPFVILPPVFSAGPSRTQTFFFWTNLCFCLFFPLLFFVQGVQFQPRLSDGPTFSLFCIFPSGKYPPAR